RFSQSIFANLCVVEPTDQPGDSNPISGYRHAWPFPRRTLPARTTPLSFRALSCPFVGNLRKT
ncbi:MAG: hypothetical protein MUE42_12335, partial [Opitutaceae bacterium]|nr:hypothetical protein [Opitutaceae bacterium]